MLRTSMGQLLVNEALPEDMRDHDRVLDKKGMNQLLRDLAQKHPEEYAAVSKRLNDIGRTTASSFGGFSFGLAHLTKAKSAAKLQAELGQKLNQILNNDSLSDKQRNEAVIRTTSAVQQQQIDGVYDESVAENNPLAMQVVSGSRGNKMNLASLRGSDMLYADHRDDTIPLPVTRSYSEGLSPMEYWAATYGARKGTMATKFCLADDTEVLMADYTSKLISEIKPGDEIMGSDTSGELAPTRVVRVYANGPKQCYRYRFRRGACRASFLSVTATEDHGVLAKIQARDGSFSSASSLPLREITFRDNPNRNDYVAVIGRGEFGRGVVEPRALLAGLMLGDGCMAPSTQGRYTFSCADSVLLEDVRAYLATFNLKLTRSCAKQYGHHLGEIARSYRPTHVVNGHNAFVAGHLDYTKFWLRETLGEALAHEKSLPESVWAWGDASLGDLLGGIFSTDGSVIVRGDGVTISLFMTAKKLVEQVKRLLELRFGVWATDISEVTTARRKNARNSLYGFKISHRECVTRFADRMNLVGIKRRVLREALASIAPSKQVTYGCRAYDREDVGELPTFDLEVDNRDHLFVLANGLIVANSTQDAGYLSKQLNQVAHRLMVVGEDDPRDIPNRGLPVDTNDTDNEGSLLGYDVGPYKRNTPLTPKILRHLTALGHDRILVRSPLVGGSADGGVYGRDVGITEYGRLAGRGSQAGLTAAQALSEPLSQGQLSAKHSGGVAGQEKAVSGFAAINQLVQTPEKFRGGAAHSLHDGTVSRIEEAPAGGQYVWVDGKRHYVAAGYDLKVKFGDDVEAGDVISEGMPDPSIVVEHKGIGEGRRYFVHAFRDAMRGAGMKVNRRNVELLSRGLINHVRLTEEYGDNVPDDVVPYSTMEHIYEPREDHQVLTPDRAIGKYLERPVLHYSVGTRIRPSVAKELAAFGVSDVMAHDEPPPFQPEMIRGMNSLRHDPDWMTRMYGSGLKGGLLEAVHRGRTSDEEGTSFVPSLARAVDFGRIGQVRTPELGQKPPTEGQPFPSMTPSTPNIDLSSLKPPAPATPSPMSMTPSTPSFTSRLGNMFKRSEDEIRQEASAVLAAVRAQLIKESVIRDGTHQSDTGSSTLGADGFSVPKSPAPGPVPPPRAPRATGVPMSPVLGEPMQPRLPPYQAVPGQQAPPQPTSDGSVHPDRLSMFRQMDPNAATNFIAGGGDISNPESGFGGSLGAVMRLGTLVDSHGLSALTSGNRYVRSNSQQQQQQAQQQIASGSPQQGGGYESRGYEPPELAGVTTGQPSVSGDQPAAPAEDWVQNSLGVATIPGVSTIGQKATGKVVGKVLGQTAGRVAAKTVAKGVPLAGVGLNTYEGISMTDDAARAKFDEKMQQLNEAGNNPMAHLKYLGENGLNWGENLRAAYTVGNDARREGSEAKRVSDKIDADLQSNPNSYVRELAGKHQRWQEAVANGYPTSQAWNDPLTGTPYTQAEYKDYVTAQRSASQNSFAKETVGKGYGERLTHDIVSRRVAMPGYEDAAIPGTNKAIRPAASWSQLMSGQWTMNPLRTRSD